MKRAFGSVAFAAIVVGLSSIGAAYAQESQIVPGATSTPPPPGPARAPRYPVPEATTLPNGLRVVAVRVRGSALVAADLALAGGALADGDAASGLASLTASLVTRGTAKHAASEIATAVDALGATLDARASSDRTDVSTDAVAARFPAALALLAEVVRAPAFAAEEVRLAKVHATSAIGIANGSPASLATLVAQRALFAGAAGRPTSGTAASVATLDRDAVVAYHRAHYRPDGAILTIGGDLSAAEAFDLAQRAFGDWSAPAGAAAAVPAVVVAARPQVIVVDQPSAGRSAIVVAHPAPLRSSADWAVASIANAVLSGYSGRLNEEIRVKRGLSYGAGASYVTGRYAGATFASTLVEHAKAAEALDVMVTTIASLGGSSPATAEELGARRTSLLGGLASSVETTSGIVRAVAANAFAGVPLDALTAGPAALNAIDPSAVTRFGAASLAAPPTIVIVGDAAAFIGAVRKAHPDVRVIKATDLDLTSATLTR